MKYRLMRSFFVAAIALITFVLTGCAGGTVLDAKPVDSSTAVFIEIPSDEHFWIWPIHDDVKTEKHIEPQGIWVTDGWFVIEDQCFSPKRNKKEWMTFESDDYETIHVHAGQRYRLQCDLDVVERINLIDLGPKTEE